MKRRLVNLLLLSPVALLAQQEGANWLPDPVEDNLGDPTGPVRTRNRLDGGDYVGRVQSDEDRVTNPFEQDYGENCGTMFGINRIVGGWKVEIKEHPWQVMFQGCFNAADCAMCGASIISPRWAVTAAHCVAPSGNLGAVKLTTLTIRTGFVFGVQDITECCNTNNWRDVVEIQYHPDYNANQNKNDIAVVKTDTKWITGSSDQFEKPHNNPTLKRVFPICLPAHDFCLDGAYSGDDGFAGFAPGDPHNRGAIMMATGWGAESEKTNANFPDKLRGVYLPLLTLSKCRLDHGHSNRFPKWKHFKIDANMTCAGAELKSDTCQGDSGGPLIYRDKNEVTTLYGATSWGLGCGRAGYPGVYARVSSYVYWIKQMTSVYIKQDDPLDPGTDNTCRDYGTSASQARWTAPKQAEFASLVTSQELIKSFGTFDSFCMRTRGPMFVNKVQYSLVLKPPQDCNPKWDETQWEWSNSKIVSSGDVHGGKFCWEWDGSHDKSEVKAKTCVASSVNQEWWWNNENGYLVPKIDMNLGWKAQRVARMHVNGVTRLTTGGNVPTAYRIAMPNADRQIKSFDFLSGYCVTKKGKKQFKEKTKLYALKCGKANDKTQWYWDWMSYQIKNFSGDKYKNGKWCWFGNLKTKKKNYIRVTRCHAVNEHVSAQASNKPFTQFAWSQFGELRVRNNHNVIVRLTRKKKVTLVNKWNSGFSYSMGYPSRSTNVASCPNLLLGPQTAKFGINAWGFVTETMMHDWSWVSWPQGATKVMKLFNDYGANLFIFEVPLVFGDTPVFKWVLAPGVTKGYPMYKKVGYKFEVATSGPTYNAADVVMGFTTQHSSKGKKANTYNLNQDNSDYWVNNMCN